MSPLRVAHRGLVLTLTLMLVLSTIVGSSMMARASTSIQYDFNTAGQLTGLFNSVGSGVSQVASGGIGNSGALNAPSSTNAVFSTKDGYSLGPVGSSYTFSSFIKSEGNGGYSGVGFTTSSPTTASFSGAYRPDDALGISVHGGGFIFHNGVTNYSGSWGQSSSGSITAVKSSTCSDLINNNTACGSPDKWFKIVFNVSRVATSTFDMSVQVWPANANGTLRAASAEAEFAVNGFTSSTIANSPLLYSYISFSGYRVTYFDNYEVDLGGGSTVVAAGLPAVVSDSAQLTGTAAALGANVTSDGGQPVTERGFVYSTSSEPTISDTKVVANAAGTGTFTVTTEPLESGTYYFRSFATNSLGTSYGSESSLTVVAPPEIQTTSLTGAVKDESFTSTIQTTGGVAPLSYSVTSGSLPSGLSLASNGVISGTPTATGTSMFTITVTDSNATPVSDSRAFSLTVGPARNPLTLTVSIPADDLTWGIHLFGTVCAKVEWGDGITSATFTTSGTREHTYSSAGTYTVNVRPGDNCNYPFLTTFGRANSAIDNDRIASVTQFGDLGITSLRDAFRGATSLTSVPATIPAGVTNLEGTFLGATTFDGDISGWLPQGNSVTAIHEMFEGATAFDGDISGWDVSNVLSMDEMFERASAFNQDLSGWDVSAATSMEEMFRDASAFNQDLSAWTFASISSASRLQNFVSNSGLDTANYSGLLAQLASVSTLPTAVTLGNIDSTYRCSAAPSRAQLEGKSWNLSDGGLLLDAPTITSVTPSTTSLSVAFSPPAQCSSAVSDYEYSTDGGSSWTSAGQTTTPITITGLSSNVTYSLALRAVSEEVSGELVAGASSATVTSALSSPPSPATRRSQPAVSMPAAPQPAPQPIRAPLAGAGASSEPPTVSPGPVVRGQQLTPPDNPLATVNGVPTPTNTQPIGSTGLRVSTGTVNLDVELESASQGQVTQNPSGSPELSVVRNQSTVLRGAGVLPGSIVQVFMAFGNQSAELSRVTADSTGSFSAQASFRTPGSNSPLPIGRHVLQVVSLDRNGNQTVVDMPITVAQPQPQPETLLSTGEIPDLPPGDLLATRGGEPSEVDIQVNNELKQATITGDDWQMTLGAIGESSGIQQSPTGQPFFVLSRDDPVVISGSGFMPLSRADGWLFSEPTLLGSIDIDEQGDMNLSVAIDSLVVPAGEHTLQIQGVGKDGFVRTINFGVVVSDPDISPATTQELSVSWLSWLIAALSAMAIVAAYWIWRNRQKAPR